MGQDYTTYGYLLNWLLFSQYLFYF